jgi:hypothetical protein
VQGACQSDHCGGGGKPGGNAVTAYLSQQFQLLALRDRGCLPPWGPACDRSAEPAFQLNYEVRCAQWPPDTLRFS